MNEKEIAHQIDSYLHRLFPICRSITGDGNRQTLKVLQEIIPISIKEYPSGRHVYDWVIPDEWNIRDAWIKDEEGNRLIDFNQSNIHVVSYSEPVNRKMRFEELKPKLHYLENLPEAIPYRTTYYKRDWGFCLTKAQYEIIESKNCLLDVCIDSDFNPNGSLTIGEIVIPGKRNEEFLVSTYMCHPSLANDNLSGLILTAMLSREILQGEQPNYTWRIIFVPETIGAIVYCAMNEERMKSIKAGLVVTTVGGPGKFGYKQSFDVTHSINKIIEQVFQENNIDYIIYPFDIHGSDERQYSSVGFRINTASITKDKYYNYPYYHTSLDNLAFVNGEQVAQTLTLYQEVIRKMDSDVIYKNRFPECEVMLSKHNLYPKIGGGQLPEANGKSELDLILWLLWYCDGDKSLISIASELGVDIESLMIISGVLEKKGVLQRIS